MKIDKIILSTNDHPDYIEFLSIVPAAWKKLLGDHIEVIVGYAAPSPPKLTTRSLIYFNYPGIPSGNMAKISRLLLACRYPDSFCLLSDIDMLPLQKHYFTMHSELIEDNNIMFYTADAYKWQEDRYPICYILAKGSVFKELINPNDLPESDLIKIWTGKHLDEKDDISKQPFSDESLLRYLIKLWNKPDRMQLLDRGWIRNIAMARIDRSCWRVHSDLLRAGTYIDAHLSRPLHRHYHQIKVLTDRIGIPF